MRAAIVANLAIPDGYQLVTSINQLRHGTTLYQIRFDKDANGKSRTRIERLGQVDGFPWSKEDGQAPDYVRVCGPRNNEVDQKLRFIGFPATDKTALLVLTAPPEPNI